MSSCQRPAKKITPPFIHSPAPRFILEAAAAKEFVAAEQYQRTCQLSCVFLFFFFRPSHELVMIGYNIIEALFGPFSMLISLDYLLGLPDFSIFYNVTFYLEEVMTRT